MHFQEANIGDGIHGKRQIAVSSAGGSWYNAYSFPERCTRAVRAIIACIQKPAETKGGKFDEFRRVVFQCSEGVIEEKGMDLRSLGFETVMMIWQNLYIYGFPCLRMDERSGVI